MNIISTQVNDIEHFDQVFVVLTTIPDLNIGSSLVTFLAKHVENVLPVYCLKSSIQLIPQSDKRESNRARLVRLAAERPTSRSSFSNRFIFARI